MQAFAGMGTEMTYFAFLKGINVSGHKTIKMAELKAMCEELGFKNVRTYIQSGNVALESPAAAETVRKKIESGIKDSFGFDVNVVIRSNPEMEAIIKGYPFSKVKGHEDCKISVGYLSAVPTKAQIKELESANNDKEMIFVSGNNLYHLIRGGFSDSEFFKKNTVEKTLNAVCTVRNWNTTNKLLTI